MSNYNFLEPRKKHKSLFVVEGYHEKNTLIKLLLNSFPEIDIEEDDIIIYGTNIYILYDDIVKEYLEDWDSVDVDLTYIVSKKRGYDVLLNKSDFNNIVLIFDYERHDPKFSEDKICRLQKYFNNSTDVGKLFINYPMIESYQHFNEWPNESFRNVNIPVMLQPGDKYKKMIKNTKVAKLVNLPIKINAILKERFNVKDELLCSRCVKDILSIYNYENLEQKLQEILKDVLDDKKMQTAKYQIFDIIKKSEFCINNQSYFEYTRRMFVEIIKHNIFKANNIINGEYYIDEIEFRNFYEMLDLSDILNVQNNFSKDIKEGIIWILNTSIFFVPDYNFSLLQ